VTTHISLRQIALDAGVEEALDTTDIEVYLHGTIASFGLRIVKTQADCLSSTGGKWAGAWHTVMNVEAASVFADRSCSNARGEQPIVVGMAIPRTLAVRLRSHGLLSSPPIPNPPAGVSATTPQYVFLASSFPDLRQDGFFFTAKEALEITDTIP
jgi:hypothetical protein